MRSLFFCFFGALMFFLTSCAPEKNDLPDNPEAVVRQWQQYLDNNEFEAAKQLSTSTTVSVLEMLETIMSEEFSDSTITHTRFLDLACREKGKNATCFYRIQEEGETIVDSFALVKVKGQWLINLPEEDTLFYHDNDLEELFDAFEQQLDTK